MNAPSTFLLVKARRGRGRLKEVIFWGNAFFSDSLRDLFFTIIILVLILWCKETGDQCKEDLYFFFSCFRYFKNGKNFQTFRNFSWIYSRKIKISQFLFLWKTNTDPGFILLAKVLKTYYRNLIISKILWLGYSF